MDQTKENPTNDFRAPSPFYQESDQQELTGIIKNFKKDRFGCISLGKDGVLRIINAERDVIDATGLRPALIEAFQKRLPYGCRQDFGGTDGTTVPREQWLHPDQDILPAPLTSEEKEATIKAMKAWEAFRKETEKS